VEIDNIMKQLHKDVNNEIAAATELKIHEANNQIVNLLLQITPDITVAKLAELSLKLAQISVQIDNIMQQFSINLIESIDANKIDKLLEVSLKVKPLYKKIDDLIMQLLVTSNRYHKKINAAEAFNQKQLDEMKNSLIQRTQESPKLSIQILDQLRTSRIQDESKQRSECSHKEQMYFSQLQDFFIKMENVYLTCQTDAFKAQLIQHCQHPSPTASQKKITLDETHPEWKILKEITQSMVGQTLQGKEVDWSVFTQSFVTVYLAHVRDLWGTYYSKLKDPLEVDQKESAYQQILPYLSNPIQMALAHLDQLLSVELNMEQEKNYTYCGHKLRFV